MSNKRDATLRCDLCRREARVWEMLKVTPRSEGSDRFLMCNHCRRTVNTFVAFIGDQVAFDMDCEWVVGERSDSTPSNDPWHPWVLAGL